MEISRQMATDIDEILREPAVRKATGWSHATLWQRVREGKFPTPVKLGGVRAVGWFGRDVIEYQNNLRAQREPSQ